MPWPTWKIQKIYIFSEREHKMANAERREITATLGKTHIDKKGTAYFVKEPMNLEYSTLEEIVERVNNILEEYGDTYTDIRIIKETDVEHGQVYTEWEFQGIRMETEEECAARVAAIEKHKSELDARNLKEFKRLKSLFGE